MYLGVLNLPLQDWVDYIIKVAKLKITGLWSLNFCMENSYPGTDLEDTVCELGISVPCVLVSGGMFVTVA